MKIIELRQNRLKIRHTPFGSWVCGGGIAMAALFTLTWILGWQPVATTLMCSRRPPDLVTCHLNQRTVIGIPHRQTLYDVRQVMVQSRTYQRRSVLVVVLSNGVQDLEVSNSQRQEASAAEIETFLTDATALSLTLQYVDRTPMVLPLLMLLIPLAIGAGLISSPIVVCTFYKRLQKVVIERRSLWQQQTEEYPLSEIASVAIKEVKTRKLGTAYQVMFNLKDGTVVFLTQDLETTHHRAVDVAAAIEQFLGLN